MREPTCIVKQSSAIGADQEFFIALPANEKRTLLELQDITGGMGFAYQWDVLPQDANFTGAVPLYVSNGERLVFNDPCPTGALVLMFITGASTVIILEGSRP